MTAIRPGVRAPEAQAKRPLLRRPVFWFSAILLVILAIVCGNAMTPMKPAAITPLPGASANASDSPAAQAPASAPVTVTGDGSAVLQIGAKLNGPFKVDYSFGSWCGIAKFLKADGSSGAEFMEDINNCADDMNANLTGSTVVHLKDVTMVQTDNTRGAWTLTFTPMG